MGSNKVKKGKRRVRPDAGINRTQRTLEEHQLCRTPGCRNVVAIWARVKGRGSGYCLWCRRGR